MAGDVNSFLYKYCLSSLAATVAESVTFPLDITKTRLQIQGERASCLSTATARSLPYRGMIKTAVGIVEEEGLRNLWSGVTPAVLRHVVYTGSRMTAYEFLRNNVLRRNPDGTFENSQRAGRGSREVDTLFVYQRIRISLALLSDEREEIKDWANYKHRRESRGTLALLAPNFVSIARRKKRLLAAYNLGRFGPQTMRGGGKGVIVSGVPCGDSKNWRRGYDNVRIVCLFLCEPNFSILRCRPFYHPFFSGCSGLIAATISTPADVVKTRIMNNPKVYRGSLDCFMSAVHEEGFISLYKGWLPTWTRMAPWSLTFWLVYERIRSVTGVAGF
ncbi:PREDICTED: mitochondrial uncoupling protein 4-like [Acropora digitifera]|uniref:mitochondrial uncoupling protein 4-like n=1 Tax=Acropora digitifera TaxID=70779 RepID=UPI00077A584D|nr:PREDICTED: mitochondrial uncoupling protein 4-like [Acropora digitifera]